MEKERNGMNAASRISTKKIVLTFAAILLIAITVIGIIVFRGHSELLEYRSNALQELTARRGEYDESRIVLSDTSEDKAKELAERLGAGLRITKDGRFAVLTLPEGTTYSTSMRRMKISASFPQCRRTTA